MDDTMDYIYIYIDTMVAGDWNMTFAFPCIGNVIMSSSQLTRLFQRV